MSGYTPQFSMKWIGSLLKEVLWCEGDAGQAGWPVTAVARMIPTTRAEMMHFMAISSSGRDGIPDFILHYYYFTLLLWKAVLPIPTGENWREYHHNVLIRNRLHPSCGSFPVVLPLAGPCPRVPGRGARPPRPPQIAGGQELGERDLVFFHAQKTTRRVKFRCAGRFRYRLTSMATSFFLPAVTTTVFRTGLNPSAAVWIV